MVNNHHHFRTTPPPSKILLPSHTKPPHHCKTTEPLPSEAIIAGEPPFTTAALIPSLSPSPQLHTTVFTSVRANEDFVIVAASLLTPSSEPLCSLSPSHLRHCHYRHLWASILCFFCTELCYLCQPLLVDHRPPPACISPPTSIIIGSLLVLLLPMVRKGKALVETTTSATAGSTTGNPSLSLNDTYFDTICQNNAGKLVGRGIVCERLLKFPDAIPDLVSHKIEKQGWNFLYNDTIPVNTTLVIDLLNSHSIRYLDLFIRVFQA
ncbi:hypothetical protein PIB30_082103 [Stylosanthes scabra]|uniref:Uncharacterized protein n=1 Tax=Stylosanthes scabra TaxID=79078 RepID=A0ABU6YPH7_9FABA|nr:hypothetical protein [Stylosanthes scabra]